MKIEKVTQIQAVIYVMKNKGGYATLSELYKEVPNVQNVEWKTKTPNASIRRIVQNPKYFFNVKVGIWALNECKDSLPDSVKILMGED